MSQLSERFVILHAVVVQALDELACDPMFNATQSDKIREVMMRMDLEAVDVAVCFRHAIDAEIVTEHYAQLTPAQLALQEKLNQAEKNRNLVPQVEDVAPVPCGVRYGGALKVRR